MDLSQIVLAGGWFEPTFITATRNNENRSAGYEPTGIT